MHLFCPGVAVGTDTLSGLETVRLTEEMVEPWAVEGISAVVHGPTAGELTEQLIGPPG